MKPRSDDGVVTYTQNELVPSLTAPVAAIGFGPPAAVAYAGSGQEPLMAQLPAPSPAVVRSSDWFQDPPTNCARCRVPVPPASASQSTVALWNTVAAGSFTIPPHTREGSSGTPAEPEPPAAAKGGSPLYTPTRTMPQPVSVTPPPLTLPDTVA